MDYPDIYHLLPATEAHVTVYSSEFDREEEDHLEAILESIVDERWRQDQKWGGREHDDTHSVEDWERLIIRHSYRLTEGPTVLAGSRTAAKDYRERLIKIAALAVAAVQAWDRKQAPGESGEHLQPEPKEA